MKQKVIEKHINKIWAMGIHIDLFLIIILFKIYFEEKSNVKNLDFRQWLAFY